MREPSVATALASTDAASSPASTAASPAPSTSTQAPPSGKREAVPSPPALASAAVPRSVEPAPPNPQVEEANAAGKTRSVEVEVSFGSPSFENGTVPKAEKFFQKKEGVVAACIAQNGGLRGASAKLKLEFLVRSRGRAEGVELAQAKAFLNKEALECVRLAFKNSWMGSPTAEPVGVSVTMALKAKP